MSVHSILFGIDPRLAWPGALVVILMMAGAVIARYVRRESPIAWFDFIATLVVIALGVLTAFRVVIAVLYFLYPGYLDWVEPMIVSASWLGWRGEQIYPSLNGGDVMGDWYGPLLFQLNGAVLWLFGPSIQSSKILGEVAFLITPLVGFWTLRKSGATFADALAITFAQCLLQAAFASQAVSFGVRSDPLLILAVQSSLLLVTSGRTARNAALLGALMGLCANLKLHAELYFVAPFVLFILQANTLARRSQLTGIVAATSIVSLALPFIPENVSLTRYMALFSHSSGHGISRWLVEENAVFSLMCLSPIIWLFAQFRPRLPRELSWFLLSCVSCMLLVVIVGAVRGAGPYHLLPFLPSLAWAFAGILRRVRSETHDTVLTAQFQVSVVGILLAFGLGLAPALLVSWDQAFHKFADASQVRQALLEIDQSMRRHPGDSVEVGPGQFHDLRVVPVFRGNPLPIDSVTWWDLKADGISEQIIRKSIEDCRVERWLLPAGGLIFVESFQPDLYSDTFLAVFRAHYKKVASGKTLAEWRCIRES